MGKLANTMGRGVKRTGKALGLPKSVNTAAKRITKDTLNHPVRSAALMVAGPVLGTAAKGIQVGKAANRVLKAKSGVTASRVDAANMGNTARRSLMGGAGRSGAAAESRAANRAYKATQASTMPQKLGASAGAGAAAGAGSDKPKKRKKK